VTPGQPSRTAQYMALFRALESVRPPSGRLFADPCAAAFLPGPLRVVASVSRLPPVGSAVCAYIDRRWPGVRTSAVARTRFIDDTAEAALADGCRQVVILGAGFDSRAYRMEPMRAVRVFEVDHPSTSAMKRAVVTRALGRVPEHVRFVAVDFDAGPWDGALDAAGYDPGRRTLVIWEGVSNYLTEAAVDGTLRWCGGISPGSHVVFTYVHARVLDDADAFVGTERLFATLRAAGERWTFGLDPAGLEDFLGQRGLRLLADLGAAEYRARCFGRDAERMRGYEFYRIAVARVARP
jgi:methyltransferase (TIGR00027 family)